MAVCVSAPACRRRGCSRRICRFQGTLFLMPTSDSLSKVICEASLEVERASLPNYRTTCCERKCPSWHKRQSKLDEKSLRALCGSLMYRFVSGFQNFPVDFVL